MGEGEGKILGLWGTSVGPVGHVYQLLGNLQAYQDLKIFGGFDETSFKMGNSFYHLRETVRDDLENDLVLVEKIESWHKSSLTVSLK
jgi:hypothetical protein